MKRFFVLFFSTFSLSAFATVDFLDKMTIVISDMQDTYEAITVPFGNCAGIPVLSKADIMTRDYNLPYGGCGSEVSYLNGNELTCAKVRIMNEEEILMGVSVVDGVELDLTGCKDKYEYEEFVKVAVKAAAKTFSLSTDYVKVIQ